jgi:hypothetical protein
MRAIVLTSSMRRHQYVANVIASGMEVARVWQEEKSFQPLRYASSAEDEAIIRRHFAARDDSEAEYFAGHDAVRAPTTRVPPGGCNDPGEIEAMRQLQPDVALVFGTGLLAPALIHALKGRIINLHLGLSPYYRGAGTCFWPLVNGEPEYCGATIHVLDAGVDSGPMLAHARPDVAPSDGPHDLGNKTILTAARTLVAAALAFDGRPLRGVAQSGSGRVYRRADMSAAAVQRLYRNFEDGMLPAYLGDRAARDAKMALISLDEIVEASRA